MKEKLLRKVLSKKHNIRFDGSCAECAHGDLATHYFMLVIKKRQETLLQCQLKGK